MLAIKLSLLNKQISSWWVYLTVKDLSIHASSHKWNHRTFTARLLANPTEQRLLITWEDSHHCSSCAIGSDWMLPKQVHKIPEVNSSASLYKKVMWPLMLCSTEPSFSESQLNFMFCGSHFLGRQEKSSRDGSFFEEFNSPWRK